MMGVQESELLGMKLKRIYECSGDQGNNFYKYLLSVTGIKINKYMYNDTISNSSGSSLP